MGTVEHGAGHLGVSSIVVPGRERCGAVGAACELVKKHAKMPASIAPTIDANVSAAKTFYGKLGDLASGALDFLR